MKSHSNDQSMRQPGSGTRCIVDAQSLAAAINEEVSLHQHDPAWAQVFDLERRRLQSLLPGCFRAIEHIGSTAVSGLVAKPIVDILAAVRSLDGIDALIERLCDNGYTTSPDFNASLSDRKWLMRWRDGHRTHHLHIVALDGAPWVDRLAFRDALRGDAVLARRYAELKTNLAAMHRSDREAYTEAKAQFVRDAVKGLQPR
jgi:GrpB-like predicted nucleotidyltransferase (UPF0157 family)